MGPMWCRQSSAHAHTYDNSHLRAALCRWWQDWTYGRAVFAISLVCWRWSIVVGLPVGRKDQAIISAVPKIASDYSGKFVFRENDCRRTGVSTLERNAETISEDVISLESSCPVQGAIGGDDSEKHRETSIVVR
jgi:hypothetical protein